MGHVGRFGGWAVVVLGLSGVLAACAVAGGSADGESAEWWLGDATSDGQLLEVATLGGGCSEFVGWVSEADDDRVHLQARWESTDADVCDSMLRVETLVLDLTEPLGGRELSGCGHEDCLALADVERQAGWDWAGPLTTRWLGRRAGEAVAGAATAQHGWWLPNERSPRAGHRRRC